MPPITDPQVARLMEQVHAISWPEPTPPPEPHTRKRSTPKRRKYAQWQPMTLIRGWRTFWRWWSTWLVLVGSTIITFAPQLSEALLYAWQIVPLDIKAYFPPDVVKYTGYAIAITGIPAKLIRQRRSYEIAEGTTDAGGRGGT